MNYSLLVTVCSLAAGLFGMERWCSWRLQALKHRGHARWFLSPSRASKTPVLADALKGLPTKLKLPSQS